MPERSDRINQLLHDGCRTLGVTVTPAQADKLCRYATLAMDWGERINLTGAQTVEVFTTHHILDALTGLPHLNIQPGDRWADVGSGAGLPGIPLAVMTPDTHWLLVEPREKRWAFLLEAVHRLELANVTPVHARIEEADIPAGSLSGVVSRALGAATFAASIWLAPHGTLACWTGTASTDWETTELLDAPEQIQLTRPDGAVYRLLVYTRQS